MSSSITVTLLGSNEEPWSLSVVVQDDDGSATTHQVSLGTGTFERLHRQGEGPEAFVNRCFEFLLAREPKESILRTFDIDVIATYFPEFSEEIAER